jgi:hypothetical protein
MKSSVLCIAQDLRVLPFIHYLSKVMLMELSILVSLGEILINFELYSRRLAQSRQLFETSWSCTNWKLFWQVQIISCRLMRFLGGDTLQKMVRIASILASLFSLWHIMSTEILCSVKQHLYTSLQFIPLSSFNDNIVAAS